MMKLLQEETEEDQRYGWTMKKMIKWPIKKLYERKLRNKLSFQLKMEEELNRVEFGQRSLGEEKEVHIYETKKGIMLIEDNEDEEDERAKQLVIEWLKGVGLKHEQRPKSLMDLKLRICVCMEVMHIMEMESHQKLS